MEWRHQYADINGIRMHYVEQGEGMPVVFATALRISGSAGTGR
jgi:hypothetical protein